MNLTPKELGILGALQAKSGRYVRTAKLTEITTLGAVRVYVRRLRLLGYVIDSRWGYGYRLVEEGKAVE